MWRSLLLKNEDVIILSRTNHGQLNSGQEVQKKKKNNFVLAAVNCNMTDAVARSLR